MIQQSPKCLYPQQNAHKFYLPLGTPISGSYMRGSLWFLSFICF
ncbi:mCG147970 [Mus musculus]|nr:mCG147970 [Mus musculus]